MQRSGSPPSQTSRRRASFRTPDSVERFRLVHPSLPEELGGTTVVHVTDLHARRYRERFRSMIGAVGRIEADFAALTGDFMGHPGDEEITLDILADLADAWSIRRGAFGVFGNHDSTDFRLAAARETGIRWLDGEIVDSADLPLRISGVSWPEDGLAFARRLAEAPAANGRFHLALAHHPGVIPALSDRGVHLGLLGHTHGGQIRLGRRHSPHTNSDLPRDMASGLLRSGGMLACVSRGVGDGGMDVRFRCPPQIAVYELHRGPLPGEGQGVIEAIERW